MYIIYDIFLKFYVIGVIATSDEIKMPIKAITSKLSIYFFIKNLLLIMEGRNLPYNFCVSTNLHRSKRVDSNIIYTYN